MTKLKIGDSIPSEFLLVQKLHFVVRCVLLRSRSKEHLPLFDVLQLHPNDSI